LSDDEFCDRVLFTLLEAEDQFFVFPDDPTSFFSPPLFSKPLQSSSDLASAELLVVFQVFFLLPKDA